MGQGNLAHFFVKKRIDFDIITLMEIEQLVKTLQASVAPCLLISGFGFLLLTMTNRLGRATDRIRVLNHEAHDAKGEHKKNLCRQIGIFFKRCRLLQAAIAFLTFSIFFVSLNVLLLFLNLSFTINLKHMIEFFFAASLVCLICSLSIFLLDIRITLQSIYIEINEHLAHGD